MVYIYISLLPRQLVTELLCGAQFQDLSVKILACLPSWKMSGNKASSILQLSPATEPIWRHALYRKLHHQIARAPDKRVYGEVDRRVSVYLSGSKGRDRPVPYSHQSLLSYTSAANGAIFLSLITDDSSQPPMYRSPVARTLSAASADTRNRFCELFDPALCRVQNTNVFQSS